MAAVLPVLMQGLQSQNVAVRRGAAEGLGLLGTAARSAIAALQTATKDPDESVAKAATIALEKVGGSPITPPRAKIQKR